MICTTNLNGQTIEHPDVSRLKIAVVSDAAPVRNGVGAYYFDLCEQLKRYVAQMVVFSPTIEDGRWEAGLVLPLPGDRTQKLCVPVPWSLQRELNLLKPDIVLVPTPGVYGLLGTCLANRMNVPVLAGFHTSFEHLTDLYWQGSIRGWAVRKYFERSNTYLFKTASSVLVNSQAMVPLSKRLGASSVKLIGTPIPIAFSHYPLKPYHGRLSRVLFAGRLAAEKNIDAVIQAARQLPKLNFSIAGDGPFRAVVEKVADELPNLDYIGWLDRDQLRDQVDAHDALVLPSYFESFGSIALEAMSRRRIVVVSRGCGIAQWPELAKGLCVMRDSERLEKTLSRIGRMSLQERTGIAGSAYHSAGRFNQRVIKHWCELLLNAVKR